MRRASLIALGAVIATGGGCLQILGYEEPTLVQAGGAGGAGSRCGDQQKNGDESDQDCGGATCPACADGKACKVPGDCASGSCSGGLCVPSMCDDQIHNGDETDVDCGGLACAPRCAFGKKCKLDEDCQTGHCACAGDGCTAGICDAVTLATSQVGAHGIAVYDANLFWTDVTAGTVMKGTVSGGPPLALATGQPSPKAIVVDATWVFWATTEGVMRVDGSGADAGDAPSLLSGGGAVGLALSGPSLFWTDATAATVKVMPSAGGPPFPLATSQGAPAGIAVDGISVFWAATTDGTIMKSSTNGSNLTPIATGQSSPKAVAIDGANVYWTTFGGVMRAPLGGGEAPTPLASGAPIGLAVDGTYAYWTDASAGTVMKVPVGGGPAVVLAKDQPNPLGIAVDGSSVYWTASAYVRKVRK